MHLEEPAQLATMLLLLRLEVGEQVDEPLEALLVSVDPEEVHLNRIKGLYIPELYQRLLSDLLEVEHAGGDVIAPLIVTLGTLLLDLPVPEI